MPSGYTCEPEQPPPPHTHTHTPPHPPDNNNGMIHSHTAVGVLPAKTNRLIWGGKLPGNCLKVTLDDMLSNKESDFYPFFNVRCGM